MARNRKRDVYQANGISTKLTELDRVRLREAMAKDPIGFRKSYVQTKLEGKKAELPHLYGFPWYTWAREMYESRHKINLLCAGNQVSKSSTFIRKNIEWATNKELWKELWPSPPNQFWYFYPDKDTATREVEKKWIPKFLPRGAMKDDQDRGWEVEYSHGDVAAIHFRTGVTIYFMAYTQNIVNLQTATVHMVTVDEEMPPEFVPEIMARVSAVDVFGYFNACFTATRGYELWYRAMECIGKPEETFKTAFKKMVSLYDCITYEDGSPSPWTLERIKERESACTSEAEVLRRVHGRFVREEGVKYSAFIPLEHFKKLPPIPKDWKYYAGVDIGSGGRTKAGYARSCAAIILIATNPSFTKGQVVTSWRGDGHETTARDILDKYVSMTRGIPVTNACYDYSSREFGLIASRLGIPFIAADKNREAGTQVLNTLFNSDAFLIDEEGDNAKLVTELKTVPEGAKDKKFQDDLTDALRYCVLLPPWNFAEITKGKNLPGEPVVLKDPLDTDIPDIGWTDAQYREWEVRQRRGEFVAKEEGSWAELDSDIDYWNDAYGT